MNFDKYTIKSQEVLQKAIEFASGSGQQAIEPGHILHALLGADENVVSFILKKLNVNATQLNTKLAEIIEGYPKVSGQSPYLSNDANKVLQLAEKSLKEFGDDYIAIEHILIGLLGSSDKVAGLLKDVVFDKKTLLAAITELRGGSTVTDQNAEGKYRSLERYSKNLNELAKAGKIDPVIGREEEIRRVLQILSRRTKNNPILVGEPGTGKTAIVEGMAQRIPMPVDLEQLVPLHLDAMTRALSSGGAS